jgi:hypothetical protein
VCLRCGAGGIGVGGEMVDSSPRKMRGQGGGAFIDHSDVLMEEMNERSTRLVFHSERNTALMRVLNERV